MSVPSGNDYVCTIYRWLDIGSTQIIWNRPDNQRDARGQVGYHYLRWSTGRYRTKHWEENRGYNIFDPTASNWPNSQICEIRERKCDNKADTSIILKVYVKSIWVGGIQWIFRLPISNQNVQLLEKEYAHQHCVHYSPMWTFLHQLQTRALKGFMVVG